MNKLIIILLFFFYSNVGAQDSLAVAKKEKIVFTKKDILVDSAFVTLKPFSKNFKKKYTDAAFIYEFKTPEKNAWDRFKEWLANFFKNIFSFTDSKSAVHFVDILLRTIAILIVLAVIYLIAKAIMNKEGQWIFGRNSDRKIINYDEIEKNLHLVDFEKLIQKSLQSDEKRLTIRYYYLWMLKKMSEKQIIEWDVEKTNSDYLYEIKNEAQKEDFAYLSYLYNNIWYGEFELDENTFTKARTAFEKSIKTINNG
ncbi:DUF4129 domain-containing protein [Flavobacterium franklandianum]|uniref:DUF4129 domain-containing protein n=1 Tax=Flavobacterium franklandianum TaxID=2594430 RepID=A0A553C7W3_9FLAO|nr:DUF4129 domain-containing protein [Flavobacterium franklandianum]TRX16600.1 DUF4129 domain-containing protein [Flavobacterium franklandianum]TRX24622.1 DUF4129 domain-containing protein [Flavobacterium franklandianum]